MTVTDLELVTPPRDPDRIANTLDRIAEAFENLECVVGELAESIETIAISLDWLARDRPVGTRGQGRYFGYPSCCVEAFAADVDEHRYPAELRPTHPALGYVLCPACALDSARRDRVAIEALITRQAPGMPDRD
jgi:hypothetical protein